MPYTIHPLLPGAQRTGGGPRDLLTALEQVAKESGNSLFILKDFHEFWKDPRIKRKLRSVAQELKFTKKSVIITSPCRELPKELKDLAVIVDFPAPGAAELEAVLEQLSKSPV